MNFRYREYRPGKWQVYFSYRGKQVFIQTSGGKPLTSQSDAEHLVGYLELAGYNPKDWGKDKSFLFENAIENWIGLSVCSSEWLTERRRLAETLLIPFFQKCDIRDIRTIHIDEFQKSLQGRGLSPKYIKNVMGELKAFFRFNRNSLPDLPQFRKIEVQPPVIRWLSEEDQYQVFEFIPERHHLIFNFLRFYGSRLNEACGILRENVFLKHTPAYFVLCNVIGKKGQLKSFTKTKRVKVLPIVPETEWLFKSSEVTPFVFSWNGKPYTSRKLYRIWERANKKAHEEYGIPVLNVYNAMRHSWACQRLNQGFSLDQVSAVLGHTSTRMTSRYAQYAVDKLSSVIRGKPPASLIKGTVHSLFMAGKISNLLELNPNMVGGTGIEPATSGL